MNEIPEDNLNALGVLARREIEARVLMSFIENLTEQYPRSEILEILRTTIIKISRHQGDEMAAQAGGHDLEAFSQTLPAWTKDDALEIEVLAQTNSSFDFNVTRCRYAEMYQALGIAELGATLSCNRDFSLIEGFNPEIKLTRTRTIMEGAAYCNFRYHHPEKTE